MEEEVTDEESDELPKDDFIQNLGKKKVVTDEEQAPAEPAWLAKVKQQLPFLAAVIAKIPLDKLTKKSAVKATAKVSDPDRTDPGVKVPNEDATATDLDPAKVAAGSGADKKKKIIRLVIIAAVVVLALDFLMPSEEKTETPEETAEVPLKKKEKKKKKIAEGEPPAENPTPAPTDAPVAESPPPAPTDAPVAESPPPAPTDTPVVETPIETPTETVDLGDIDIPEDTGVVEAPATENPVVEAPTEAPINETPSDTPVVETPSEGPVVGGEVDSLGTDSAITGLEGIEGGDEDLTDKILLDLEKQIEQRTQGTSEAVKYVPPPDYENSGRGLVYNCRGKHWACVDGPSFKVCEQNFKALQNEKKAAECFPQSVYQSDRGCNWTQKQMIVSNAPTNFCK